MSHLEVAYKIEQPIQPMSSQIGPDWLCYLAGPNVSHDFFHIFSIYFLNSLDIKPLKPMPSLLTHIILARGGVSHYGDEGYPIPSKDDYYQQEPSLNVGGVPLPPASSIGVEFLRLYFI